MRLRISVALATTALAAVTAVALTGQAVAYVEPQEAAITELDEPVAEPPNAVAVSNDGVIAASLHDAQSIALVTGPFTVRAVPIGCSPHDVAIAPDATYAWAVCQGNSHVMVIEVSSGTVSAADIRVEAATTVAYVPAKQLLVVGDLAGQVVTVSVRDLSDYAVIDRIPTPDFRTSGVAPLPDGGGAYVVCDCGRLAYVDFARDAFKEVPLSLPDTVLTSITLSQTATRLYAGAAVGPVTGERSIEVVAIAPPTGTVLQRVPITFGMPGMTTVEVAAGHRSLSVSAGLPMVVGDSANGAIDIALDADGRMGAASSLTQITISGSAVSRSADGARAAVGNVDSRVLGIFLPEDQPYPPTLGIAGTIKGGTLTVTGTTTGVQPGTVITVHVKDLTRKRAPFVTQAKTVTVDGAGTYRWKGKVPSKRVSVFTTALGAASGQIRVLSK